MDTGMKSTTWNKLVAVLAKSAPLKTDQTLRSFFLRESLQAWEMRLRFANTTVDRAIYLVRLLYNENYTNIPDKWFSGMKAIEIMLVELYTFYTSVMPRSKFMINQIDELLELFQDAKAKIGQVE